MSFPSYDAWVLARVMADLPIHGEVALVSEAYRPFAEGLAAARPEKRAAMLDGFALGVGLPPDAARAIGDADPLGPTPARQEGGQTGDREDATLADVRRLINDANWPWPSWLAGGALTSLAADPGIGKTLLAMTLARIVWTGRPWPDGQANPMPAGTRTLWVPGDHHYPQLLDLAGQYDLPDEAVILNASKHAPTGGHDLDDPAALEALSERVAAWTPGLVIVDTVGMTTGRNLGKPEEAREYFGPLMSIAGRTKTSFLLLTHLSKDNQALGRRIIGASRVVWKLTHPDPDGQPDRRKFWVDKSYGPRPPALGMTIGDEGCTFDFEPPAESPKDQGGRPPVKLEECKKWLTERLTPNPAALKEVRSDARNAGFVADRLYQARGALGVEEYVVDRRTWWKLPLAGQSVDV
jgi:AAA domain